MKIPIEIIAIISVVIIVLVAVVLLLSSSSIGEADARNVFTQGCLKYCDDISKEVDPISAAISQAEQLEGSDFMNACKSLYNVQYNWQCWNRNCCEFRVYSPL